MSDFQPNLTRANPEVVEVVSHSRDAIFDCLYGFYGGLEMRKTNMWEFSILAEMKRYFRKPSFCCQKHYKETQSQLFFVRMCFFCFETGRRLRATQYVFSHRGGAESKHRLTVSETWSV